MKNHSTSTTETADPRDERRHLVVRLQPAAHAALRQRAAEEDAPMSVVVRRALKLYLRVDAEEAAHLGIQRARLDDLKRIRNERQQREALMNSESMEDD